MQLYIKALHIICMVTWFSALFYLPRLYVYHAMTQDDIGNERFKIMERKLYRGILIPSSLLTIIFGIWLISFNPTYYLHAAWMHAKLSVVFLLLIYQHLLSRYRKDFLLNRNIRSHVFYRVINEIPVFFLITIVVLVIVKPF